MISHGQHPWSFPFSILHIEFFVVAIRAAPRTGTSTWMNTKTDTIVVFIVWCFSSAVWALVGGGLIVTWAFPCPNLERLLLLVAGEQTSNCAYKC